MKKILFLIHDLSVGGAEKVLVNLVNNMDREQFDITVATLFGGGVNEQFLLPHIKRYSVWKKAFRGNSKIMKLLTPAQLHRICVRGHYDIEVSYLEGPSARVISGCRDVETKLVSWIHVEQHTKACVAGAFRSYAEAVKCYQRYDRTVCVSEYVKNDFLSLVPLKNPVSVLYNTNESAQILEKCHEPVEDILFRDDEINLIGIGKISPMKGFDRLARIHKRLREEHYLVHTYILGIGPEQKKIQQYLEENAIAESFSFLGYQINPYKYVAKSDLFVCASWAEGFSTAATEALIVGTPVCTVNVSGMKEMLGENNEYGIVTENDEESLYRGIRALIDNSDMLSHYKIQARKRGKLFSTDNTVRAVEKLFLAI